MAPYTQAQLSLRRAFRIGYYAFMGAALLAIGAVAIWFFSGELLTGDLSRLSLEQFSGSTLFALGVVACGLCVPLFFGLWSMVGTAVLGPGFRQPTIYEDLRGL